MPRKERMIERPPPREIPKVISKLIEPHNPHNYPCRWEPESFIGTKLSLIGENHDISNPNREPIIITEIDRTPFNRYAKYRTGGDYSMYESVHGIISTSTHYLVLEGDEVYCVANWQDSICIFGKLEKDCIIYTKFMESINNNNLNIKIDVLKST